MILTLCIGIFIGATMVGGAAAAGVVAQPTWQPTYVDGRQVQMDAYNIGGYNYVKLRDIGKEVGFNVFWDNGVQVDTTAEYTGVKPADSSAAADTGNASAENNEVSSKGTNDPTGDMKIRLEIVQRINEVRAEHGMTALAVNESLMSAAQECSQQLLRITTTAWNAKQLPQAGIPMASVAILPHLPGPPLRIFHSVQSPIGPTPPATWKQCSIPMRTVLALGLPWIAVGPSVICSSAAPERSIPTDKSIT